LTVRAIGAPVLRIRSLAKSFTLHTIDGRRVASLRGVDLDVHAGEHVALAGPSGAGKSSLLRCVNRTYLPDSGSILLHRNDFRSGSGSPNGARPEVPSAEQHPDLGGARRSDLARSRDAARPYRADGPDAAGSTPADRFGAGPIELTALTDRAMARLRGREFGYVAQFLNAPPRTGPMAVVTASARRRGLDEDAARDAAADILHTLNVDEALWDVDCGVLSGGERQRVNLAAGIVSPPRLLLLDEPVSALDPRNREVALQLVGELAGRGVAVLAVFHDLPAMYALASRVVSMGDGRILAEGSAAEVLGAAGAAAAFLRGTHPATPEHSAGQENS
jgi:alpha-D-ribose 1-methylphosphonate 5-triphosphate synthase subunit PhnL